MMTAEEILEAVKVVSTCLDHAPLAILESAHALVREHFMEVMERTHRSLDQASEQRVVGALWSEIELAICRRRNHSIQQSRARKG
jgi:hypothetical protein